jgi:hypothetical protein
MLTVKKIFVSVLAGAFVASLGAAALAHPGHVEHGKKSQKRSGKHAANKEKTGTLALLDNQKVSVELLATGPNSTNR